MTPTSLISWLQNWGVLLLPIGSVIHINNSKNSGKCYTYDSSFIIAKGYKSEPAKGRVRSGGRIPTHPLSSSWGVSLPYPPGISMCDNMQRTAIQGNPPELWCLEFLLGFHCLDMIGGIICHEVDLNLFIFQISFF